MNEKLVEAMKRIAKEGEAALKKQPGKLEAFFGGQSTVEKAKENLGYIKGLSAAADIILKVMQE